MTHPDPDDVPTRHTEANALLALLWGDRDRAERLVEGMVPGDLFHLINAAGDLHAIATHAHGRHR